MTAGPGRYGFVSISLLIILLLQTCSPILAQQPAAGSRTYDFYSHGPYRAAIPRPSAILGYEVGETHSTYRDQERALLAIAAAAKDRVRVVDYGKSVEGRPLRLYIVGSPENINRLEEIREDTSRLADPRTFKDPADADRILKSTPCITWINHCIHGDETASFEGVMWTLYTLAASRSPEIETALKDSVVILNPVFNPDGHERFVVYYNSIAVGSPLGIAYEKHEPWAVYGRLNHYRFDMNRDKIAQSQPETRQETAAFLHWHPQVFADEHGQPETYFFPPNAQATNSNVDRARLEKWTDIFGRANGAAFDKYGWRYVTRETFDFFYPGYLDSWTTLTGAIGMTYETDGGGNLARERSDGTISTLRDAIAHHYEASLATIFTAAKHRQELLHDYLIYRQESIRAGQTQKIRRVVILPGADPNRAAELAELLTRVGIEVKETTAGFSSGVSHAYLPDALPSSPKSKQPVQNSATFPVGSLIVDLDQPQGRMAHAFLEPDADFEPEFVKEQLARRTRNEKKNDNETQEEYGFYDTTAWSLPYAYGLEAYWTEDASNVATHSLALDAQGRIRLKTQSGGVQGGKATVAYLIPFNRDASAYLALRLLKEDYRLEVATRPVRAGGKDWSRGTLIAFTSRNPETLHARIASLARDLNVDVTAINTNYGETSPVTLGSDSVVSVRRPRIAVVADDSVDQTSYGAIWFLFARTVGLDFTPVSLRNLRGETMSRFNVVILPDGGGYSGELGKEGIAGLKSWVGEGNVLIGLGGGGSWFTEKDAGLSSAASVGGEEEEDKATKPTEKKKTRKPIDLPGAIFSAQIDPTHFLGYGYPDGKIVVPLSGSTFLKPSKEGANVVTFGKGPSRLSGFIWPDNTEEFVADTAYVIDEPIGRGHALLFLNDPNFRALWTGLRRCFLSGVLFGPSRSALKSEGE